MPHIVNLVSGVLEIPPEDLIYTLGLSLRTKVRAALPLGAFSSSGRILTMPLFLRSSYERVLDLPIETWQDRRAYFMSLSRKIRRLAHVFVIVN